MAELGAPAGECDLKKCQGTQEVLGHGADDRGRPIEWRVCDTCGRTVEHVDTSVPQEQQTLDLGGAT